MKPLARRRGHARGHGYGLGSGLLLASVLLAPGGAAGATTLPAASASAAAASGLTADQARRANDLAQAAYYENQLRGHAEDKAPWWGSLVLGAGLTLGGSIATLVFTNRFAAKKALEDQTRRYRRQKLQVGLAVRALIEALVRFDLGGVQRAADFLSRDLLLVQPLQPRSFDRRADYYLKYDLVSTIYRLCALLGWMELYRIDPEFMSGDPAERARFESSFSRIRTLLGDDLRSVVPLGSDPASMDPASTRDGVILADDQRAIGERMLTQPAKNTARVVVGYAFFAESLFRFPGRWQPMQDASEGEHADLPQDHWIWNATSFIVGMGDGDARDLRVTRLRELLATLRPLLPSLLSPALQNGLAGPGMPADL